MAESKQKRIKVLFVIDSLMAGGKERRLSELLIFLKQTKSVDFELVLMNEQIHYNKVIDLGIKIHYIIRKSKKDLTCFRKIYMVVKNFRPNIIHCWDSMSLIYSIPAAKLLGIKLINGMIADAPIKLNFKNPNYLRSIITFPFSDIICGNSKAGLKVYRAPKNKSYCIYNGYNPDRLKRTFNDDQLRNELLINTTFVVGMVATFSDLKDYRTYFKAASKILQERKDVTFIAIGRFTDSQEAQALIEPRWKEQIKLIGAKKDIDSYINLLDIGVLCTYSEGLPNAVLEYMALGKPVIATEGGGTSELVIHKKAGYLVEPMNIEQVVFYINTLLNNSNLRQTMGMEGKRIVESRFTIKKMATDYLSIYDEMIKGKFKVQTSNE